MKLGVTQNAARFDGVAVRFDHAPMLRSRTLLVVLLVVLSFGAFAADDASTPARFDFDLARQKIAEIQKKVPETTEAQDLGDFRDTVAAFATAADAIVADRTPRLAELDARLAELGPAPAKGAPPEAADIAAQRNALTQQRTALDAEVKRAKVLGVETQQVTSQIDEARRASFQARVSQRTASPLTPTFWRNIREALREDGARLATVESGMVSAVADSFAPDNRLYAIGGIVIAILLVVVGRWWAEGALMRLSADRVPHGRLRRSSLALAIVVVVTLSMGLAAEAIVVGFDWHDAFSETEKQLAHSFVNAAFFASFVFGLGRALISPTRPSWRLPPIPDATALAIRGFPLLLALVIVLSIIVRRINALAGASISATVAASFVSATLYSLILLWALMRIARARRRADAEKPKDAEPEPSSLTAHLALIVIGLAAVVALIGAVSGFIAFAQLLAALIVRVLIVGATFYLLVHLIEDVFFTLTSMRAKWMQDTLGVRSRTLDQLSVVFSGAFRLVAFLFAMSLIFSGFGSGRAELSALSEQIGSRALSIGEIRITPDAVLGAFGVLIVGVVAVRALKRWLHDRYLPTTSLDPAMRSSVTTLLGYVAGTIVFLLALSALGFSIERIAWVASALSVGIGFGLQAVVQNFVSGLILLVERPVKVGDWVALGDVEGDIRRINVRATEIQMGDRSTMIVPNSELITKTVRNVTLANAQGRVQVRLPMPLDTDADVVLRILGEAFTSNSRVLSDPAPSFTIDGIQNATLIFVGVGFIENPRQAGGVRSEILLTLLARLREAGIRMVAPQEVAYRPLDGGPVMADIGTNPS